MAVVATKKAKQSKRQINGVNYVRNELSNILLMYYMIRDCIDGEMAIKGIIGTVSAGVPSANNGGGAGTDFLSNIILSRARRYLPMPNADDQSASNVARYRSYVQRAVFYNVTSRTLEGMVGQVFLIDPVSTIPASLDNIVKDADGQGVNLLQLAKRAVRFTMSYGRAGLLVDYPPTEGATTKGELESGDIQPVIQVYPPWDIINWQTEKRGAKTILTLIVLRETIDDIADDGFTLNSFEQYRVLRIDPETGFYTVCLHAMNDDGKSYAAEEEFTPTDYSGKPMTSIPFTFIGSENNDVAVDKPPMFDLASLNIAHYRNSADFEESSFIVGQPTPVAIGLTEDWVKNVLKGQLSLGSRGGIPLPPGADAKLLQASPNTMPSEAMKSKEEQMVAIGAKLVIQKRVQKTATEAIVDTSSESSVLTNVANNVSSAFEWALRIASSFVGTVVNDIKYKLNTEFELNRMTADDQAKLVSDWQKGALAFSEMREALRKSGVAILDDDAARAEITKDQAMVFDFINAGADPNAGPSANPNSNPTGHARNPASRGQ